MKTVNVLVGIGVFTLITWAFKLGRKIEKKSETT